MVAAMANDDSLLELIRQRDAISKLVDEEFEGMPATPLGPRRYYCYRRGMWVTGEAYDLGAKRESRPLPVKAEPDLPTVKGRKKPYAKPQEKRDAISEYLRQVGTATTTEIAEAVGLKARKVRETMKGLPVKCGKAPNDKNYWILQWTWIGD